MFIAAVSAFFVAAAATPVQGQAEVRSTAFRLFHDVCLPSDGDISKLIDLAGRNGFSLQLGVEPRTIGRLENAIVMPLAGDRIGTILVVGWQGPMLSCRITSNEKVDAAALTEEVQGWVGFSADPRRVDGSVTNYFYVQTDRGRAQLLEPEQQGAAIEDKTFRAVWTSVGSDSVTLNLTAPPKDDPSAPTGR
tara:strand:- start:667 stop:1242 length:576 start_codon:yes stop_codon:yes gene_type:complete